MNQTKAISRAKRSKKVTQSKTTPYTRPKRQMASNPPRRNLPKNQQPQAHSKLLNENLSSLTTSNTSGARNINGSNGSSNDEVAKPKINAYSQHNNQFQQDYVQVMKNELNDLDNHGHSFVPQDSLETIEHDPNTPLTSDQLSRIYGMQVKLKLPQIPLNGTQAFWALPEDPNNPFTFPLFNLATLLAPTDLSVSIDPKDSDVPAEKILDDYKTMMATTVQQGGGSAPPNGNNHQSPTNSNYKLNQDYTQNDLENSLNNIANPHLGNPLQAMAMSNATPNVPGHTAQMATSRLQFNRTILVSTPVRRSQLTGLASTFKISIPNSPQTTQSTHLVPTETDPSSINPLNNIVCLAKASNTNKRFDIFLSRAQKNVTERKELNPNDPNDLQSLFGGGDIQGMGDAEEKADKSTLIFTSNISHNSLNKTKVRLKKQVDELTEALAKRNKTYTPPFEEHVCIERNYLIDLDRDPSLVPFPFSPHDTNKTDPITHLLTFPMRGSTITYSTDDPLEEPSNDSNYRLAEAEFLIQCCLMGQNFPAPIDPKFAPLIEQDRNGELEPDESQRAREVMGRSVVAMYGHGSGLAAEFWSLKRPMIKSELYKRQLPQVDGKPRHEVNYELDISYGHNDFYQSLYNFSLLPTEAEIAENLKKAQKQMLSMAGGSQEMLDQISKQADEAFGILQSQQQAGLTTTPTSPTSRPTINSIFQDMDFAHASVEEIEVELSKRMKQIEQRQYQFQQKLDEEIRIESVQRRRAAESQGIVDDHPQDEEGIYYTSEHEHDDDNYYNNNTNNRAFGEIINNYSDEKSHYTNVVDTEVVSKENDSR